MALTQSQLEAMQVALQTAMYNGVRSVTFQDRTVQYASVDDMRKALSDLGDQINSLASTTPSRRSYAAFSRE